MKEPAHISIHDVAPQTLSAVQAMLTRLADIGPVMLLVIPGKNWSSADLNLLREWVAQGHVLAGHGWRHEVETRQTLTHKLHGTFISRYVAEHLSLDEKGIAQLMQRNYDWFITQGLPPPTHYVPPAWALGPISVSTLAALPFQSVETLSGIWRPQENTFKKTALLGYEADTFFRAGFLKMFNRLNRLRAADRSPIRLALHPYDFTYALAEDILNDCRRYRCQAHVL